MLDVRALRPFLRLGPIALCTLTAHAALYRSLLPADGVHGYFGWYEPAVAALSLVSAATVGAAVIAALLGRRSRTVAALGATAPTPLSGVRLSLLAVGWLVVQETIERSVSAGGFEPASFDAGGWSIIVVAATVAAGALTLLARVGVALVEALAATPAQAARAAEVVRGAASVAPRKRRALAGVAGLRAPPAAA